MNLIDGLRDLYGRLKEGDAARDELTGALIYHFDHWPESVDRRHAHDLLDVWLDGEQEPKALAERVRKTGIAINTDREQQRKDAA